MNDPKATRRLQHWLLFLVLVLTFEGILRKKAPPGFKQVIFFLKDFIAIWLAVQVARMRRPSAIRFLSTGYATIAVLMTPLIIATAFHDPILALFGAKQYLLFPVVGLAVFLAFENATREEILRFFRWIALLVIPTSLVALLQSRLSPDHWLNLSVGGTSLEIFSAGDKLRVSSTFPFVAQYGMFLNAQIFITAITLTHLQNLRRVWKIACLSLLPLLVVGSYITGSRGAVVGNVTIVLLACGLAMTKLQSRVAVRIATLLAALYIAFIGMQHFFPSAFIAYRAREEGKLVGLSSEVRERTLTSLFDWANVTGAPPTFLGYGLGVMSNGSEALSSYAAGWRSGGAWTETDYATTLFEGGFYLMVVWYGFRYFVIYQTARRFLGGVKGDLSISGAFCLAYVIMIGFTGTLGIQPPMAIWWWLGVGTSLVLWWKCVEPQPTDAGSGTPGLTVIPPTTKLRGRSIYAEQLHSGDPR